jgi:hypothetical protein
MFTYLQSASLGRFYKKAKPEEGLQGMHIHYQTRKQ